VTSRLLSTFVLENESVAHPYDLDKEFQDLVTGSNELESVLRKALYTEGVSDGEREQAHVHAAKLNRDILMGVLKKMRDLRTSIDRLDETLRHMRTMTADGVRR
jgi:hypothetical protein